MPGGAKLHVSGFADDGLHVTDVWESEQAFSTFMEKRLAPVVQELGIQGQPEVKFFPLHGVFVPALGVGRDRRRVCESSSMSLLGLPIGEGNCHADGQRRIAEGVPFGGGKTAVAVGVQPDSRAGTLPHEAKSFLAAGTDDGAASRAVRARSSACSGVAGFSARSMVR